MGDNDNPLVADGRNKTNIFCTKCESKILTPGIGEFVIVEAKALPKMTQEKNSKQVETDIVTECFQVDDIFKFENVGFTYALAADKLKYLACSDCEFGPLGWQNLETGVSYVALSRVRGDGDLVNSDP